MQTSPRMLIPSFSVIALALSSSGAFAQGAAYTCVISSKGSSLVYAGGSEASFPALLVGNHDPATNPGGTRTLPGLTGGSGNVPISCTGQLSIGGEALTAPGGSFRLVLNPDDLTGSIEEFSLQVFSDGPADLSTSVLLDVPAFRTVAPNSIFVGGLLAPVAVGPAQVTSLSVTQSSTSQPILLEEVDVGVFGFATPLDANYALSATARGETLRSGQPYATSIWMSGTIAVGEGGAVSVSVSIDHYVSIPQSLTISGFAQTPMLLETVDPPGQLAGVRLSGSPTQIVISSGFGGTLAASGSPEQREADLNSDLVVDFDDLSLVLSHWGLPGPTDLDSNGTTDALDLALVLHNWG